MNGTLNARATRGRALLSLERMRDHLARFEWPSEDEHATDVTSVQALGAHSWLLNQDPLMSAAANKTLMQRIFAEIESGKGTLFAETLSDKVVMRVTGQYTWSRTFVGKEAVLRDLYGYVRSLVQRASITIPLRFIAEDDYVVVEARGDMTTKAGEKYDNEYCLVYRFEDGKIVEMREYCDSLLCEQRLGLFPERQA